MKKALLAAIVFLLNDLYLTLNYILKNRIEHMTLAGKLTTTVCCGGSGGGDGDRAMKV